MTYLPREILTVIDGGKDLFDELEELMLEDDEVIYDDLTGLEVECEYTVDY